MGDIMKNAIPLKENQEPKKAVPVSQEIETLEFDGDYLTASNVAYLMPFIGAPMQFIGYSGKWVGENINGFNLKGNYVVDNNDIKHLVSNIRVPYSNDQLDASAKQFVGLSEWLLTLKTSQIIKPFS